MGIEPVVPDLAATTAVVRKRRAPKHDFKDGKGKVFAHRHDYGGGWVADTAYVAPGVKVTRNAEVFDYAKIYDQCQITGSSKVFGHARLFDSVQLNQKSRVHGNAIVGDDTQLHDTAIVCGNSQVFGSTRLSHRVLVNNDAFLTDVYAQGPACRAELMICGNVRVFSSRLYSYSSVSGNAVLENCNVRNSYVAENAKMFGSSLTTDFGWQDSTFLSRLDGFAPALSNRPESDVRLSIANRRCRFYGLAVDSQFTGSGVQIGANIRMINTRMMMRYTGQDMTMPDAVEFFNSLNGSDPVVFCNIDMLHDVSALRQHLAGRNAAASTPVTAPGYVPPTVGVAPPNLEIIRQRRLMRLEGE